MNKYVIEYSTGEWDDYEHQQEPLLYDGTIADFNEEFLNSVNKLHSRAILGQTLQALNLIGSYGRTWMFGSDELKIGSSYFDISDHSSRSKDGKINIYPPDIYTLDDWFKRGIDE